MIAKNEKGMRRVFYRFFERYKLQAFFDAEIRRWKTLREKGETMVEFLVGIAVIVMMAIFALLGVLLLPLLLLMGFFLRFLVGLALLVFAIWLLGKTTLVSISHLRKREGDQKS